MECLEPFVLAPSYGEIRLFKSIEALQRDVEADDLPLVAYDSNARVIDLQPTPAPRWYEIAGRHANAVPRDQRDEPALREVLDRARECYRDAGIEVPEVAGGSSLREEVLVWVAIVGVNG